LATAIGQALDILNGEDDSDESEDETGEGEDDSD